MEPKLLPVMFLLIMTTPNAGLGQDCSAPFVPSSFKAKLAWQSAQDGVSALSVPIVANMNPQVDSMPEIMVAGFASGNSNTIQFFKGDGSNAASPYILTVPTGFDTYPAPGPTVGDIDGDGIPELLMSCYDNRIRVFKNYTENPSGNAMTLWITSTGSLDYDDQRPYLADFNGDGTPEVYAGNDKYKFDLSNPAAPTVNKIINGNSFAGQAHYDNYSQGSCNPTAVDILTVAECNNDPDGAGLELVAGPVIYSVDVDLNDGDGYQLKIQRNLNSMVPPANTYADGYTAVADMNLDGILDIIVTSRRTPNRSGVYVWNKNGLVQFMGHPGGNLVINSGSLACVANVYDDTRHGYAQDFPEILICSSFNFTCYNLHAAQQTPATPYWWNLPTSDYSGWTGSTVYDFNGDGIFEIVYRDEQNLRILYGGPAPFPAGVDNQRNWFKMPTFSGTSDEYPVVADVDNDGETEIAVTGRLSLDFFNYRARLRVVESDAGPWVPSRNVWNQYNYFVVNINDDLSVPAIQPTHHLELPAAGSGNRPLNRYLSQRPMYNDSFQIVIPLPDAAADATPVACKPDSISIELKVCNTGDQTLHAGVPVAFYRSDPTTTNALLLGAVKVTPAPVPKDSCLTFYFTVPKTTSTIYGVINDDGSKPRPFQLGTDFPVTNELECNWLNNMFRFENFPQFNQPLLGPDVHTCTDTILLLEPPTTFVTYLWQDGSTGKSFNTTGPGLFWVETTDFCFEKHRDTLVAAILEHPFIQLDTLNGDCSGTPASVRAQAQSSYQPLSFEWSTGDTSPNLDGLSDGMYTVTVTNARGCTSIDSTWVEAGGYLLAAVSVATPIPCFGQTGSLTLDLNAGRPPFVFSWSNGLNTQNLFDVAAGDYQVTVTDADQCSRILDVSLPQPPPLVSSGLTAIASCPGLSNGSAAFLGASQGTPPYNIQWSNASTDAMLNGLAPGLYQLSLSDANGCSVVEQIAVPEFAAPVATPTVSDVRCHGANDGSIFLSLNGGTPGFGYQWSNTGSSPQIDHLSPGTYALTLTYAGGACSQTFDFQINEPPPLLLDGQTNPARCHGGSGGSIDLQVQNGVAPLAFQWSNTSTQEDLANVISGNYSVTVTDASGCSEILTRTVPELPGIDLSYSQQMPLCFGQTNGQIELTAGGGTPPFSIMWSNGAGANPLTGIGAGSYTATITDAAACTEVRSIDLGQPTPLLSNGISALPACPGEANGGLDFLGAAQGTPPYTLTWFNNSSSPSLTGLSAGSYNLTVTDANGCILTETATVPALVQPTVQPQVTDVSCFAAADGSIAIDVLHGTPGFSYAWSSGQNTAHIDQLAPGVYTLELSYADGKCGTTYQYAVQEPPALILADSSLTPVRCFGDPGGAIQVSIGGGVQPYQYQWSSGQQSPSVSGLPAGSYQLTLTDANHCTLQATFDVAQPAALQTSVSIAADTCETGSGAIALTVQGGVSPYAYAWAGAGATGPELQALVPGNYSATVTDANTCTRVIAATVPPYGLIPHMQTHTGEITCAQPAVSIGVSTDQSGLHYLWQSGTTNLPDQAEHTVSAPGTYRITVSNGFGCTASGQLIVTADVQAPVAEAGAPFIHVPCYETSITLDATGSSQGPLFENTWTGAASLDTTAIQVSVSQPGWYFHTVWNTDNGCSAIDSVEVAWDNPIQAELEVEPILCFGDNDGAIRLEGLSGGTLPYQYSIDGQHFSSQTAYLGLQPGVYPLRIRDGLGCTWQDTVVLTEPPLLQVDLTASDTFLMLGQNLQLTATPSPANADLNAIIWEPATFSYSPMSLIQRVQPETHTAFKVRIVDNNGCVAEDRIQVSVYNYHIYVPNVIYPESNENGWFTIFSGDGVQEIRLMRVYDRWGELLFENRHFATNELTEGWDGTFRGQPMNPAVFGWYAELLMQDGQVLFLKGDVTVVR